MQWLKDLNTLVRLYRAGELDGSLGRTAKLEAYCQKEFSRLEDLFQHHNSVEVSIHGETSEDDNYVVVCGRYRGREYIHGQKIPKDQFETLVCSLIHNRLTTVKEWEDKVDAVFLPRRLGWFSKLFD